MAKTERTNAEAAALLDEISQLLELTGADRFRAIANQRAGRIVGDSSKDLIALARQPDGHKALTQIEGIGPKIADKIIEFAQTGRITEHDELLKEVPPGLPALLRIPGLGPKTVRVMWTEAKVTDLDGLKRIIADGSILKLPRMGEKTVQNIKEAIEFAAKAGERVPLGIALPLAEALVAHLKRHAGAAGHVQHAGSLRRGRDTIGDIDILVSSDHPEKAQKAFTKHPQVEKVIVSGETRASVRLDAGGVAVQADLRVVPEASYGAALMYFTGSKEFNIKLRERALKKKMTLNEYGLFPLDKDETPPHQRGVKPIASRTEEEIFKALGVPFVPPELREDRDIDEPPPSPLIEIGDIKAELHAHTTASDGALSIVELAEAAKARGFHTIAVTDHSQSSVIANGLKPDRLRKHIEAVREAAAKVKGITILAGSEVDILADGSLDYDDKTLSLLDVVVASPHASLRQEPKAATERLLKAVKHPLVHILGHPTGRLINRREGFAPDIAAIAAAAAEYKVALEINANWQRLDLRDVHVRTALDAGALIAIDCDVHGRDDFDQLRYGIMTARRAGLTPERCINAWPAKKLHAWLKAKR